MELSSPHSRRTPNLTASTRCSVLHPPVRLRLHLPGLHSDSHLAERIGRVQDDGLILGFCLTVPVG